jgi:DNA-binding MarR family transcriptional regulator
MPRATPICERLDIQIHGHPAWRKFESRHVLVHARSGTEDQSEWPHRAVPSAEQRREPPSVEDDAGARDRTRAARGGPVSRMMGHSEGADRSSWRQPGRLLGLGMPTAKGNPSDQVTLGPVLDFLRELWALDHAFDKTSKRMLASIGITAEQRVLIRIVGENPGISAGQLAELLHVDAGTTSAALRRLEERKLLVRGSDPNDGRRVTVNLTSAGMKLSLVRSGTVEGAVERTLAASQPADVRALRRVLARLIEALEGDG